MDRTPPEVVSHQPPADATNVALDAAVEIVFSKSMDPEATQDAVFVSPELEVRTRLRRRRLRLDMKLVPNRTYVITVGADARDQRGNRLERSFTYAFSTGKQIDRGHIAGRVYQDHQPASGVHVWAYDLDYAGETGRDPPQYRTQTGSHGRYAFERLAASRYRLIAFVDANRNRELDPGEWRALPDRDLEVAEGDTIHAMDLALEPPPVSVVQLERVRALDTSRMLLVFSQSIEPAALSFDLSHLDVKEIYAAPQDPKRVYLRTAEQSPGTEYTLRNLTVEDRQVKGKWVVRGARREDSTPPQLVAQWPEEQIIAARDTLVLVFDESMRQELPPSIWADADSADAPEGTWFWRNSLELAFAPREMLEPGPLELKVRLHELADHAGLAPRDSTAVFRYQVLGQDDLATIDGQVVAGVPVVVTAESKTRQYSTTVAPDGSFELHGLLPGRYLLHAYADRTGDGKRFRGRLQPFRYADPYTRWPEPVELAEGSRAVVSPQTLR